MKNIYVSRRRFLATAGIGSTAFTMYGFGGPTKGKNDLPPSEKLNVACVGVGGKGRGNTVTNKKRHHNVVALCDVDDKRAEGTFKMFPDTPKFKDYRKMLDKMGNEIDAVVVSTPDHMHYHVAMAAVQMGKHVYVEKPVTHSIKQMRELAKAAKEKGVATQMGNQGHSAEATRLVREWIQAGVIGPVKEVRCWTNRPIWPQGMQSLPSAQSVPATLDWDLWRGDTADYAYNSKYLPFKWRGWYAFGCGALGDMGCHVMDPAYFALDIRDPVSIYCETTENSKVAFPNKTKVTFEFPARGEMPPMKLVWYDGDEDLPECPVDIEKDREIKNVGGSYIIGEKATILTASHCQSARVIPEIKMQELAPNLPPKTLPRVDRGSHHGDWLNACKGKGSLNGKASSNFEYSGKLTELCLLGAISQRFPNQKLEWDKEKGFTNNKEANVFVDDPVPKV
ncbi:Gfo/Idh/MocA family oxidoreductase [Verrucomicrobiota bacterium]